MLYPIASLKDVGGLMRPGTTWAMSESELQKFPGFGRDMERNRVEAKRLLVEAGYPNGFKTVLKNRNVRVPYVDFGTFVIQEWRNIGIEAELLPLESASWFTDGRDTGNFELIVSPSFNFMDDPDQFLERIHHRRQQQLGALLRSPDRRPLRPPGPGPVFCRAQEAHRRGRAHRARPRLRHSGHLVGAERGAPGQGEELRGAAESLLEPEAAGCVAQRGLIGYSSSSRDLEARETNRRRP